MTKLTATHMGLPIDPAANHKRRPLRPALPKDVQRMVAKTPHLIRATADVAGTVHQLCLRPSSPAIRDYLRRDLSEVAGRALALLATLDGGKVSSGVEALVKAHKESYLTSP